MSSLHSINCFSSSVKIFANGVGQVNKMTLMKEQIIVAVLDNRYHFRSGNVNRATAVNVSF
ncbi:MAG: DUF1131 family protein [Arsenophonus sp. NC-TX2-MAG3]